MLWRTVCPALYSKMVPFSVVNSGHFLALPVLPSRAGRNAVGDERLRSRKGGRNRARPFPDLPLTYPRLLTRHLRSGSAIDVVLWRYHHALRSHALSDTLLPTYSWRGVTLQVLFPPRRSCLSLTSQFGYFFVFTRWPQLSLISFFLAYAARRRPFQITRDALTRARRTWPHPAHSPPHLLQP